MPRAEPAGVPTRRAALRLLGAVLREGLPLEAALEGATRELDKPEDRALAHAIAAEALRRLPDLDALIDRATERPLPADAKARFVLRIALVQALRLGTPPYAAIATALPLLAGGPRRLVHGVFGRVTRLGWTLPEIPALPPLVASGWRVAWGEEVVEAASQLIAAPPPLVLSLAEPGTCDGLDGVSLLPGHVRLPAGTAVPDVEGYAEGRWWVQDIAASLPARMLGAGGGREALDLCAAPGGKTLQLAASGWKVTAVDISEKRLERLSENLARTGFAANIAADDLMAWSPPRPVPAILLDAPCSATGIFRRHPDVLHRFRASNLPRLAATQAAMLARAAGWLAPEGVLVYSVCSLEREEGEEVVAGFLAKHPGFRLAEEKRLLPGAWLEQGGADAFYIAKLARKR
ncbi:MAG: RsmB/NOP family class I SAM-dependent RNA methyltransferase [Sphingosinicella sp.]